MNTIVLTEGVQQAPCSLEAITAYRHPALVRRFEEKLGIPQEAAEQLFDDTKKFLYLCGTSEKPISPNKVLDFGWHEFILFTENYSEFCQTYFGRFIHHRPRNPEATPTNREGGQRAIRLAREVFGDNLSGNWFYPLAVEASTPCDSCGCNSECTDGP